MMAPDINSMPTSPRPNIPQPHPQPLDTSHSSSTSNSRRTSQIMGPPVIPASNMRSPTWPNLDQGLPLRHPRPLTAAELYLECEKEQEAVVNRLTRELSALRAQSASVASNASSSASNPTSLLPVDIGDPNPAHQLTGATHPAPSRRDRSSSSLSARSATSPSFPHATTSQMHTGGSVSTGGPSQASADRAAAAGLSRQPSGRTSGTSTPARRSMDLARSGHFAGTLHTLPHRPSVSRDPSHASSTVALAGTPVPQYQQPSPAQSPGLASPQFQTELAAYRAEMDHVKAENEALRQRVRALERALQTRRRDSSQSDLARPAADGTPRSRRERENPEEHRQNSVSTTNVAAWAAAGVGGVAPPRERSESQSTTASSRRPIGIVEDELHVGDSAGSTGLNRTH